MGDDIIKDLIDILPQIIIYIVTGYIFNKTFHFVALKQNSTDIEHILTSSLVIGFIFCKIANLIPIHITDKIDTIGIMVSSLIIGYLFAKIVKNRHLIPILDFLRIRDTGNLYYWDDIMDEKYPMKVKISCEDVSYEGMLHNFESYSNEPHVILASYVIKDKSGNILQNYTNDNTKIIILDTAKVENIEVTYANNSEVCHDLKSLCDSNILLYNKNNQGQDN